MGRNSPSGPPLAGLRGSRGLRIGAAAVAAVIVAEAGVWLMRPRGEILPPAQVSEHRYFSDAEIQRAEDFRDTQRLIGIGSLVLEGAVLTVIALWRPAPVRRGFDALARRPILGGAAVGAGISLTLAVTGLPLAAVAQERARDVGLATQTLGPWLGDQVKAIGIGVVFAAVGGAAALGLIRRLGRHWWIGGTVLVIVFSVVFTWLAPVVLAPVFNKFEVLPAGRDRSDVLELGRRAGVDIGQVYRIDASKQTTGDNAYVDGLGSSKRVVLYDNTLRDLDQPELRSVVAHELGHVKGDDVWRGIAFVAIAAPLAVLFVQLSSTALAERRGEDPRTPAGLPAVVLMLALASFGIGIVGNQLSRRIESRADTFALELTHDPKALIDLQQQLAVTNLADPQPPAALQFLFGTHPTTMERIGAALTYRREATPRPRTRAGS
jgi:STE24 endopeptidase